MRLIEQPSEFKFAYEDGADVADALEAVATKVYRADGVDFTPAAKRQLAELRENGFGNLPVCVAKTQYSFSDNAKALRPRASASPCASSRFPPVPTLWSR